MDKIKKYQDIVINFLNYYQVETGGNHQDNVVKRNVLVDREHNSFQLLSAGWNGNRYVFGPLFHFDIIDEKIWMQCNNTEWEVVDYLMAHGVDKQDIVLGFIPPKARHLSGFAAV